MSVQHISESTTSSASLRLWCPHLGSLVPVSPFAFQRKFVGVFQLVAFVGFAVFTIYLWLFPLGLCFRSAFCFSLPLGIDNKKPSNGRTNFN